MYKKTTNGTDGFRKKQERVLPRKKHPYILYYASYDSSTIDITRQPVR